jgi:GNAT superfamily N-acetyltransferase
VTLRPLRKGDVASIFAWLPDAARAAGCDRLTEPAALMDATKVLVAVESEPSGVVQFETGAPHADAALVRALIVAPDRRRLGIGGRAAVALERRLARTAKRVFVPVPSDFGLALYFWLRLGYRPLTQAEWPAAPGRSPSTWMVRELR